MKNANSNLHADAKPSTRTEVNRANATNSTGPKSIEGKARASANSLKHGFFAATDHLDPQDAPAYQTALTDLRTGMQPANPAEDQAIRELATFRARLLRLQSIEYVLLCSEMASPTQGEATPGPEPDSLELTAAFLNNEAQLTRLSKAEAHLQRAYNRTWDRLLQLQKDRKLEASKRSQHQITHNQQTAKSETAKLGSAPRPASPAHQSPNLPVHPPQFNSSTTHHAAPLRVAS